MFVGNSDLVFGFLHKCDDFLGAFLQNPSFIGQLDFLAAADKQLLAELFLHILELP